MITIMGAHWKKVRDALRLVPGDGMEFGVNTKGQVVVHKAGSRTAGKAHGIKCDRFDAARGKAQVKVAAYRRSDGPAAWHGLTVPMIRMDTNVLLDVLGNGPAWEATRAPAMNNKEAKRVKLHKTLWHIAHDLRGSVDET